MSEMLTATTFESFRVYSLDTLARLREALQLCEDVRRQRVPRVVLEPLVEELIWSFGKDSATRALAANEIDSLVRLLRDKSGFPVESLASHIKLILKLTESSYKATLEELILAIFNDPKQKIEIRKLTGFYCSHLVNLGYSRRHVLEVVSSNFLENPVQRVGRASLSKFFREFDGKQKRFLVLAAVARDLNSYLRRVDLGVREVATPTPDQQAALAANPNYAQTPSVIEIQVSTFDPHGAMDDCYQMLSAQRAISYLDPYGMQAEWGSTMHVTRFRAQHGVAVTKGDFLTTKQRVGVSSRSLWRSRSISTYAKSIIQNFDAPSTERILSSIRTAALARSSRSPENQLISLWSAIEVLLSEPKDEARIVHYAALIAPCIVSRHTRRQVHSIYEELLIGHRTRFNKVLRRMPGYEEMSPYRAFAEMMLLPEHEALRTELAGVLSSNPLALHRLWKLRSDYKDVKSANRTICDHADRVRWQIHRVYRARNQLVHAGRMPSYLESVILNLAEYYRSSIATIVNRAKQEDGKSDIDQTVAEIGIKYGIFRSAFDGKAVTPLTADQIAMLMDWK